MGALRGPRRKITYVHGEPAMMMGRATPGSLRRPLLEKPVDDS